MFAIVIPRYNYPNSRDYDPNLPIGFMWDDDEEGEEDEEDIPCENDENY